MRVRVSVGVCMGVSVGVRIVGCSEMVCVRTVLVEAGMSCLWQAWHGLFRAHDVSMKRR